MIDAKELRIGNCVNVEGETLEVFRIDSLNEFEDKKGSITVKEIISGVHISYKGVWCKRLEPIPITKEWLLKFGFMEKPDSRMINGFEYLFQVNESRDHLGEFEMNRDGTWFAAIGTHAWERDKTLAVSVMCRGNYVCHSPMYVHELQNLYFALTGEELKLKNK